MFWHPLGIKKPQGPEAFYTLLDNARQKKLNDNPKPLYQQESNKNNISQNQILSQFK